MADFSSFVNSGLGGGINLPEPQPGDPIYAEDYSRLVRAVKDRAQETVAQPRVSTRAYGVWVRAVCCIPKWSIFGPTSPVDAGSPPTMNASAVGGNGTGSPLALLTNGPVEIPAGRKGVAVQIDLEAPTRLRLTGPAPGIGRTCGVDLGRMAISASGYGLVCMSDPDADCTIWVMRTPSAAILGRVTETLTAASLTDRVLGAGKVAVQQRVGASSSSCSPCPSSQSSCACDDEDDCESSSATPDTTDEYEDAVDPATGTAPWILHVKNALPETVDAESIVHASETLVVGLVVTHVIQAASSSSSATSSASGCKDDFSGPIRDIEGYEAGGVQVLVNFHGCLKWVDVTQCPSSSSTGF